jgi:hypothetical protein
MKHAGSMTQIARAASRSIVSTFNRSAPENPGVPVTLNGERFIVPSLLFGDFQDNIKLLTMAAPEDGAFDWEGHYKKLLHVIGLAFRVNYPEITDEELGKMVTVTAFAKLLKIVQGASGLVEVEPGE